MAAGIHPGKKTKSGKKKSAFRKIESVALTMAAVFLVVILSFAAMAIVEYVNMSEYVEADVVRIVDTTVVVGSNCTAIVAETSPERAASIQLGIDKRIEVRPNTHDLLADILENFNITLRSVTIDSFEDGIYYATLHLNHGEDGLRLDSKPSDAIAIALRSGSPIYISQGLLQKEGQDICK